MFCLCAALPARRWTSRARQARLAAQLSRCRATTAARLTPTDLFTFAAAGVSMLASDARSHARLVGSISHARQQRARLCFRPRCSARSKRSDWLRCQPLTLNALRASRARHRLDVQRARWRVVLQRPRHAIGALNARAVDRERNDFHRSVIVAGRLLTSGGEAQDMMPVPCNKVSEPPKSATVMLMCGFSYAHAVEMYVP